MADSVKGSKFTQYSQDVQIGIKLHREIDSYTDQHEVVKRSKNRIREKYGLYSGVIVDIFYDHFLAKNWDSYSAIPLEVYVDSVYELLKENIQNLPEKTQHMLPFMIEFNWLYNYQFIEGMQRVLDGMNRRTKNRSKMNFATEDLQEHYEDFEKDFTDFFKELRSFSSEKLKELTTN